MHWIEQGVVIPREFPLPRACQGMILFLLSSLLDWADVGSKEVGKRRRRVQGAVS